MTQMFCLFICEIAYSWSTNSIKNCKMSSPSVKNNSDSNANKQRKSMKTNSTTIKSNLDTRAELADLIKKKAETSVMLWKLCFIYTI